MYEQNENVNKDKEIIKRNQTKMLELKGAISEMKKSLDGFKAD